MVLLIQCIIKVLILVVISAPVYAFKTSELKIYKAKGSSVEAKSKPFTLKVEVAVTDEELQKGLMFRKKLDDGAGMIFLFDEEGPRSFWMKNTLIPLSIAFADKNKTIFQISDLKPVTTLAQKKYDQISSQKHAKYVIEVPQGWFKKNNINPGAQFSWEEEPKFLIKNQ